MIYSWGTDTTVKQVDPQTVAVCRFRYVGFAFIFKLVWQRQWFLQGRDRALDRQVEPQEIESLYGPGSVPSPGIWRRFGAVIAVGAVVLAASLSAAAQALVPGGDTDGDSSVAAGLVAVSDDTTRLDPGDETLPSDDDPVDGAGAPGDTGDADNPTDGAGETSDTAQVASGTAEASGETAGSSDDPVDGSKSTGEPVAVSVDAVASVLERTSDESIMSTDLDEPAADLARVTVDRVHATDVAFYNAGLGYAHRSGTVAAAPDHKLVIVDVQILNLSEQASINEVAFRLVAPDGRRFAPSDNFVQVMNSARLFNEHLFFEVPVDLMAFTFEAGVPEGVQGGFRATWNVELVAGDVSDFAPADGPIVEGPAQVSRTSEDGVASSHMSDPEKLADFEVLGAEVAAATGGAVADPGFQWVVVDIQALGRTRYGRISDEGFRVRADGEWYPAQGQISSPLGSGSTWSGLVPFEVPIGVDRVTLEVGTPSDWQTTGGRRATWELTLPPS